MTAGTLNTGQPIVIPPVLLAPPKATRYDGTTNAFVTAPASPSYDAQAAITIEAWVKRDNATRSETIVSHDRATSYWLGFSPKLRFYRGGGAYAEASVTVPAHKWTHVAVSYDGSTARFYVDGAFVGSSLLVAPTTPLAAPTIGQDMVAFPSGSFPARAHLGRYTIPFSIIGLPVISVPVPGFGLPRGVQLVAAPFRERALFRAAAFLEARGIAAFSPPS